MPIATAKAPAMLVRDTTTSLETRNDPRARYVRGAPWIEKATISAGNPVIAL
jgi:hypothetical protein